MFRSDKSLLLLIILIFTFSCQKKRSEENTILPQEVPIATIGENPIYAKIGLTKLSEYGFFEGNLAELNPTENVIPYELNSPLFSDYAKKQRFIQLPVDSKIELVYDEVVQFPVGTILIKNFYYDDDQLKAGNGRIIETRLLIREEKEWKALPYIWNEEQTEAYLEIAGFTTAIALNNLENMIQYSVPTMLECKSCHEKNGKIEPIGPTLIQLNRDNLYDGKEMNQLAFLHSKDWMGKVPDSLIVNKFPDYDDPESGTLDERARAYLDVNCAHCHRPEGPAKNSGLNLRYNNEDLFSLGVHKAPVAAGKGSGGLSYDIVPGKPEESILFYRMGSIDPAIMMPEIGKKTTHQEGIDLIKEWIVSLE